KNLANSWQTRLYLFVLAETSDYEPDQISMTYWFIPPLGEATKKRQTKPQCLRFPYSRQMHQQTQQALTQLLSQLTIDLHRYEAGESLSQVAVGSSHCSDCPFMSRCQRGQLDRTLQPLFSQPELLFDLNQIEEIML
ncbi:MAG TPA: PD-(D/E)XK nuclease family protein, partial [Allocoleopsis sp.]